MQHKTSVSSQEKCSDPACLYFSYSADGNAANSYLIELFARLYVFNHLSIAWLSKGIVQCLRPVDCHVLTDLTLHVLCASFAPVLWFDKKAYDPCIVSIICWGCRSEAYYMAPIS
jgi:hypothetical protein